MNITFVIQLNSSKKLSYYHGRFNIMRNTGIEIVEIQFYYLIQEIQNFQFCISINFPPTTCILEMYHDAESVAFIFVKNISLLFIKQL